MSNFKQKNMKTLNIKTILIITFFSLFVTSCTDLYSDDNDLQIDNIENTNIDIYGNTGGEDNNGNTTGGDKDD